MAAADIFRALGDPIRLEIVQRLRKGNRCTISTISEGLCITRQGARKHLQVLADAQVVALQPHGRDVLVSLEPETLDRAKLYITEIEQRWDTRLDALRKVVEE
jgi:DNA-binding transcriptional ArsR family regulator